MPGRDLPRPCGVTPGPLDTFQGILSITGLAVFGIILISLIIFVATDLKNKHSVINKRNIILLVILIIILIMVPITNYIFASIGVDASC